MNSKSILTDQFGRKHTYLRISLTDKCNFRCVYCMPTEKMKFLPTKKLMSAEEIEAIAESFVKLGVTKIRLTGGEPLVRPDFSIILKKLSKLPVSLHLSTNAFLLDKHLDELLDAGVQDINISIDSLNDDKFNEITKVEASKKVRSNIELALLKGFHIKLNTVLMRGINDNEIHDLILLTKHHQLDIRFIEFMPFAGNNWKKNTAVFHDEVIERVKEYFDQSPLLLLSEPEETSKKYQLEGFKGTFGIISTVTKPFCETCNRIRLTADGKIKNCLFASNEISLLDALRDGKELTPIIGEAIYNKAKARGGMETNDEFELNSPTHKNRSMVAIGG